MNEDTITPQDLLSRIRERDFYLKKPRPALLRPWAWILVLFPLSSTLGLAILAFFGFGFTAVAAIPNQAELTLWAARCLALGEVGSFFAVVEVFRKYRRRETAWWDWVAISLSAITTIAAVVVGWAWATGSSIPWQAAIRANSALIMATLAVLDTTLAGSEGGLYLGEEAQELKNYQEKYDKWARKQEAILRDYNNLIIAAERAYFEAQLRQWEASNIVAPVNYTPQAEDKVLVLERCWCGAQYPEGQYTEHFRQVHLPEVQQCQTAAEAVKALKRKYTPSKHFPSEDGIRRWMEVSRADQDTG